MPKFNECAANLKIILYSRLGTLAWWLGTPWTWCRSYVHSFHLFCCYDDRSVRTTFKPSYVSKYMWNMSSIFWLSWVRDEHFLPLHPKSWNSVSRTGGFAISRLVFNKSWEPNVQTTKWCCTRRRCAVHRHLQNSHLLLEFETLKEKLLSHSRSQLSILSWELSSPFLTLILKLSKNWDIWIKFSWF